MKGSYHYNWYERTTKGRLRREIITIEESVWLVVGLAFGWFAAKGTSLTLLLIPLVLFVFWVYEKGYAKTYGIRTVHGRLHKGN